MKTGYEEHLASLEDSIGYRFGKREILVEALTHASFVNESCEEGARDNQRLEFFGDAVLGLFVSGKLLEQFPSAGEGRLSRIRASLVNEKTLASIAERIQLGRYLRLGRGEEKTGGREKHSLLADAYEALVAAVYIDGGASSAQELVLRHFSQLLEQASGPVCGGDYKTRLQELMQDMHGQTPRYVLEGESGPPHDRMFTVSVFSGESCLGKGTGRSKKAAEQAAARQALIGLAQRSGGEGP